MSKWASVSNQYLLNIVSILFDERERALKWLH